MDSSRDDGRIESYLAAVEASMGKVPSERREALVLELRGHVDKLVEDYEADGKSKAVAVDQALSMMGEAQKLGRQYARMWYRSTEPGSVLAAFGVLMISNRVIGSLLNPIYVRFGSHAPVNHFAVTYLFPGLSIATAIVGTILMSWVMPKGATRALMIQCALVIAASTTMWIGRSANVTSLVMSQLILIAANLISVGVAAAVVRLRMRKFAGI